MRNDRKKNLTRILALLVAIAFLLGTFFMTAAYLFTGSVTAYGADTVSVREDASDKVPEVDSESVLLYDHKSDAVLYEKNADAQRAPASITKIMTCSLVLEDVQAGKYSLDDKVTISWEMVFQIGSHMGLVQGEVVTVEQLVNGLMIASANDAAIALAIFADGSLDAFIQRMNDKAAEIGADHTHYISVNGYTESPNHTTTARDLKTIVDYALEVPGFREIIDKPVYRVGKTNKSKARTLKNTNKLFYDDEEPLVVNGKTRSSKYEGVFGVKTGMMREAGYCLIAGAERDGTELICICLKADSENNRFADCIVLLDWAFRNFETHEGMKEGTDCGRVKVRYGRSTRIKAVSGTSSYVTVPRGTGDDIDYEVVPDEEIEAPIEKGDKVGHIDVYAGGTKVQTLDLLAAEKDVVGGPWTKYYISDMTAYIGITALILLVVLLIIKRAGSQKRRRSRRNRY